MRVFSPPPPAGERILKIVSLRLSEYIRSSLFSEILKQILLCNTFILAHTAGQPVGIILGGHALYPYVCRESLGLVIRIQQHTIGHLVTYADYLFEIFPPLVVLHFIHCCEVNFPRSGFFGGIEYVTDAKSRPERRKIVGGEPCNDIRPGECIYFPERGIEALPESGAKPLYNAGYAGDIVVLRDYEAYQRLEGLLRSMRTPRFCSDAALRVGSAANCRRMLS